MKRSIKNQKKRQPYYNIHNSKIIRNTKNITDHDYTKIINNQNNFYDIHKICNFMNNKYA